MLKLARERPSLSIVDDQTGCPTWARNLAGVTQEVISTIMSETGGDVADGIYHYCDRDVVSWYEFARSIFVTALEAGILDRLPEMKPVRSAAFPQKARRPGYSVLNTSRIRDVFGIEPAGLMSSLRQCIGEMAGNEKS
jgi:dTDP-4-dehydrorhamnose reductase